MKNLLGIDLEALLSEAVKESVDAALGNDEKQKQKAAAHSMKPFKAKKKSREDVNKSTETVDEEESGGLVSKKSSSNDLPEIDLNAIVELVGSIRAGRSLKDKGALKDLKMYFNRLNGNERTALYAFLTGISKIMRTPDAEETPEPKTPDAAPYSVKIDKISKKVKNKTSSKKSKKSDDSPIIVGESADKREVIRSFRRNSND